MADDDRMRAHPANERILAWLGVRTQDRLRSFPGDGFDEGGRALFNRYGYDLPERCKWSLGVNNVMVHPDTGLIFAVSYGRFTFLLRRCGEPPRRGDTAETLDGTIDLRLLEGEWWQWWFEDDDDVAELRQAYVRAGHG